MKHIYSKHIEGAKLTGKKRVSVDWFITTITVYAHHLNIYHGYINVKEQVNTLKVGLVFTLIKMNAYGIIQQITLNGIADMRGQTRI